MKGTQVSADVWWACIRWRIARDTGWTLNTIEELSLVDIQEYLSVLDAERMIAEHKAKRAKHGKGRRR